MRGSGSRGFTRPAFLHMANLIRLRAVGRFKHDGKDLVAGDIFSASEEDAADLCCKTIGLAERAPDEEQQQQAKRGNTYKRRDVRAEE